MRNINKSRSFTCIILSIILIFTSISIEATPNDIPISDAEHKQTIEQFLREIDIIQNQVFDIAQVALRSPSQANSQIEQRINLINTDIERLNQVIQDYLSTVPGVSERNRHVLLTFNVLNLVKSGLYTLSLLVRTNSDAERLALLDEYFRSRVTALDTLAILEELLAN